MTHPNDGDLQSYFDDEFGGATSEMHAHVTACATCTARLMALRVLRDRLLAHREALSAERGPRRRLSTDRDTKVRRLRVSRVFAHAAAALLLVSFGYLIGVRRSRTADVTRSSDGDAMLSATFELQRAGSDYVRALNVLELSEGDSATAVLGREVTLASLRGIVAEVHRSISVDRVGAVTESSPRAVPKATGQIISVRF